MVYRWKRRNRFESVVETIRQLGLKVSVTTVKRRLYDGGLKGCKPARKPLLSFVHRSRRVHWCRAWRSLDFGEVIFSDEKKWVRIPKKGGWVWRCTHERFHPKCLAPYVQAGGGSLMVWGAISKDRVFPLQRIESTLNGEGYKKVLDKFFPRPDPATRSSRGRRPPPPLPPVFQHDNASIHTSRVVEKFLHDRRVTVLPWPALSPDLSPIENLWNIVSKKVYAQNLPTLDDLWSAIQREWNATPPSLLATLYDSMPRRMDACVKARGYPTKY